MDLDELDARAERVAYESSVSGSNSESDSSVVRLPSPKRPRTEYRGGPLEPLPVDSSEYEEPDFTDLFAAHDVLAQNHARGLANLIAHLENEAEIEEGDDIDLRTNAIVTDNGHLKRSKPVFNGILESLVPLNDDFTSDESSDSSLVDEVERAEAQRDGTKVLPSTGNDRGHTDLEIIGMELVRSIAGKRAPLLERLIEMSV